MKPFVDWCSHAYRNYPNFRFQHIDVYNKHYNPDSKNEAKNYRFPFKDESFDLIYMTSVFTHMRKPDVENYLKEVSRMLKRGGICFITYFLINEETLKCIDSGLSTRKFKKLDDVTYTDSPSLPEKAIALQEDYIRQIYKKCDLELLDGNPVYGAWRNPNEMNRRVEHNQDRISAYKK